MLLGLVQNAIEAVDGGGEIAVEWAQRANSVEIAVSDTGPGVPEELRSRVFEPFFTTRAKGVGLGLAIARQVVEAHGGTLDVGSGTAGGARFVLTIPSPAGAARVA